MKIEYGIFTCPDCKKAVQGTKLTSKTDFGPREFFRCNVCGKAWDIATIMAMNTYLQELGVMNDQHLSTETGEVRKVQGGLR